MPTYIIVIISLAIFALAIVMALRGISLLKKLSSIAGTAAFVMSILFIVMIFAAKAMNGASFGDIEWSIELLNRRLICSFS